MDLAEMRGSGATRVETDDYLATCCSTVCILMSDAVIEYKVGQGRNFRRRWLLPCWIKEFLINKQRKRQYRWGRLHAPMR